MAAGKLVSQETGVEGGLDAEGHNLGGLGAVQTWRDSSSVTQCSWRVLLWVVTVVI